MWCYCCYSLRTLTRFQMRNTNKETLADDAYNYYYKQVQLSVSSLSKTSKQKTTTNKNMHTQTTAQCIEVHTQYLESISDNL